MTDKTKPIANLEWSLYVRCPECLESNDISSGNHDSEHYIAQAIFSNQWDKLEGHEVQCEFCRHEFTIDRVVY